MEVHAPIYDSWETTVRNRGYRADVVQRVHAARREQARKAETIARKERHENQRRKELQLAASIGGRRIETMAKVRAALPKLRGYKRIEALACLLFDVTPDELRSGMRAKRVVFARHFAMYWMVRRTKDSYPQIGRKMGGKDHTTVIHGVRAYVRKRKEMGRTLPAARGLEPKAVSILGRKA